MKQEEEIFARLVREHKSTIYTVCYMFSKDEDEVQDLFQEPLINMWKGMGGFREESKIDTWIYRVALNTCLTQERKKKREVKKVPLNMDVNYFEDNDANAKQARILHQRISQLAYVDRALVMLWLDGMSYDEMGAVVGISAQNVATKLFRIKEQLKKMKYGRTVFQRNAPANGGTQGAAGQAGDCQRPPDSRNHEGQEKGHQQHEEYVLYLCCHCFYLLPAQLLHTYMELDLHSGHSPHADLLSGCNGIYPPSCG